ncbi:hypothetical protein SAMN05444166_6307 [Singulisphaera sp. GP187]|uniref:hypothetical protein n=1 Tax=Singulisphaera sp. GP187 TaxID=1882752 RepID=UPI0009264582|nr:hypothetical protein [Singulisphaera sp. GP187]SIO60207.1 hypothetical protein SAMN05444166_6307 [Singulisphaera sp. GP187]
MPENDVHMGNLVAWNLYRLGHAKIVVPAGELADKAAAVGRPMTRQRVNTLIQSPRITDEMVEVLAHAVGVEPAELLRPKPKGLSGGT